MGTQRRSSFQQTARAAIGCAVALCAWTCLAGQQSTTPKSMPTDHPPIKAQPTAAGEAVIDLNSASKAQLKTLYGIGDAEAERIIAARPFLSKADIVSNADIPAGVYLANKRRMIALQKAPAATKR